MGKLQQVAGKVSGAKGEVERGSSKGGEGARRGATGGQGGQLRGAGSCQLVIAIIFAMAGVHGLSTTAARKNFEKFDWRGDRKEGQPLRLQQ